jgi:hypothetical protein
VEIYAMQDAQQWRRNRRLEELMLVAAVIGNRIPMNERGVDVEAILGNLPGYDDGSDQE